MAMSKNMHKDLGPCHLGRSGEKAGVSTVKGVHNIKLLINILNYMILYVASSKLTAAV